jgi:hypothetical protein
MLDVDKSVLLQSNIGLHAPKTQEASSSVTEEALQQILRSVDFNAIEVLHSVNVTMPDTCTTFITACGEASSSTLITSMTSWADVEAGFVSCCMAGGHHRTTCSSIASEAFTERTDKFVINDGLCTELNDMLTLHRANAAAQSGRKSSSLLEVQARHNIVAMNIASFLAEVKDTAPTFVKAFLGKLFVGAAMAQGLALTQVGLSQAVTLASVTTAIATHLTSCDPSALQMQTAPISR